MGSASISRGREARFPTCEKETPLGETLTPLFLQVGLALYLGDMLKTMVGASKKLEANSAMAGHQNAFPSKPKATTPELDLLQTLHYKAVHFLWLHRNDVYYMAVLKNLTTMLVHEGQLTQLHVLKIQVDYLSSFMN